MNSPTNAEHYLKLIKDQLNAFPKKAITKEEEEFVGRYLGTKKKYLGVKTGDVLKIAKDIARDQDAIPAEEMSKLLSQLFSTNVIEDHIVGGKIFTLLSPENRSKISFDLLKSWLSKTNGWVEVDVICQSSFTAPEVLARWGDWQKAIKKFSKSSNIQVRRASLVMQNISTRKADEKKIQDLAFETVDQLKSEKEVLITKAVSWLLRCLVCQCKDDVKEYLLKNESTLPRIAFRETMKKIETGKK
ncbi:MAG: DNA alkylation repair protein [Patescibacteria group bacterium]|nr:DNA alkylation repair protein [Patescibacteria group bacterium]